MNIPIPKISWSVAVVAVLGFMYWRHHNGSSVEGVTRTEEAQAAHEAGSDWLPNLWGMINGQGQGSAAFPNVVPGANADPGGAAASQLGLNPSWDGSLK